jgi:hypothetical protein
MTASHPIRWLVLLACNLVAPALWAAEPCDAFRWDVSRVRALFATPGQSIQGGADTVSAPPVQPDRLYQWQLLPQSSVSFVSAPGRSASSQGANAGLARLHIDLAGAYRIALDQPGWIDVVAVKQSLTSKDFQGVAGCQTPRKIVEFDLPADSELWLQISGVTAKTVRLTVTRP